jgi:hypothetical protein
MSTFSPPISFHFQGFVSYVTAIVAFVAVVAFFLYENLQKRSLGAELALAVIAALTLGTAIFFALIRADVIL